MSYFRYRLINRILYFSLLRFQGKTSDRVGGHGKNGFLNFLDAESVLAPFLLAFSFGMIDHPSLGRDARGHGACMGDELDDEVSRS